MASTSFKKTIMETPTKTTPNNYAFGNIPDVGNVNGKSLNVPMHMSPLMNDTSNQDLVAYSDDTGSWHETKTSTKMAISQNIDKYVSSFTCHGLSRIFKGTRAEKVLWSTLVVGGLIMAVIITYGLIIKYFSYNVYTEISSKVTNRYQMPSITFCHHALKQVAEYSYCGIEPGYIKEGNATCTHTRKFVTKNLTTEFDGLWTNGYFTVLKCKSSGILRDCNSYKHLKSSGRLNNSCFTWNYEGHLFSNLFESSEISFIFNQPITSLEPPSIVAYVHEPGTENDFSRSINLVARKTTRLTFDKTVIKRLPTPFPSNCTMAKSGDIFPGIYSRISCLKSRGIIYLYKQCGDIFDYAKDLIPNDIKRKYKQNKTVNGVLTCFSEVLEKYENEGFNNCPLPCEELDLDISQSTLDDIMAATDGPNDYGYSVVLYFPRPGTYKVMEEKELYPWDQIACELGGFVGIALGCSLLSLFEIIVCLMLSLMKWLM